MKFIRRFFVRSIKFLGLILALATIALLIGVQMPLDAPPSLAQSATEIRITDVTIIDPQNGQTTSDQTVLIANGKIQYVGSADAAPVSQNALSINGKDKYLIPALWDMHVHTINLSPQLHFPLLIANGVTHIRDMGDGCSWKSAYDCKSLTQHWRDEISAGKMLGPVIHQSAHYHIEGLGDDANTTELMQARAKEVVTRLKQRGDELIKLQLSPTAKPEHFYALLHAAEEQQMAIAGHLPYTVDLLSPDAHYLKSIEHDSSLLPQCAENGTQFDGRNRSKKDLLNHYNEQRCEKVLAHMKQSGMAYVPTHIASNGQDWRMLNGEHLLDPHTQYVVAPQRWMWRAFAALAVSGVKREHYADVEAYYQASLLLTQRAQQQGVSLLAGTDAMDAYVTHGFSLHEELQQLVKAGLTPAQALASATTTPAAFLGMQDQYGKIAANYHADVLLLNSNPLLDIRNTQSIDTVINQGRVHDKIHVKSLLDYARQQANSYAMASQFIWRML